MRILKLGSTATIRSLLRDNDNRLACVFASDGDVQPQGRSGLLEVRTSCAPLPTLRANTVRETWTSPRCAYEMESALHPTYLAEKWARGVRTPVTSYDAEREREHIRNKNIRHKHIKYRREGEDHKVAKAFAQ